MNLNEMNPAAIFMSALLFNVIAAAHIASIKVIISNVIKKIRIKEQLDEYHCYPSKKERNMTSILEFILWIICVGFGVSTIICMVIFIKMLIKFANEI